MIAIACSQINLKSFSPRGRGSLNFLIKALEFFIHQIFQLVPWFRWEVRKSAQNHSVCINNSRFPTTQLTTCVTWFDLCPQSVTLRPPEFGLNFNSKLNFDITRSDLYQNSFSCLLNIVFNTTFFALLPDINRYRGLNLTSYWWNHMWRLANQITAFSTNHYQVTILAYKPG